MRLIILGTYLLLAGAIAAQSTLNLVPWPAELTQSGGSYQLKSVARVLSDIPNWDKQPLFNYLKKELQKHHAINVVKAAKGQKADIQFLLRKLPITGKPAYRLTVNEKGIIIEANDEESVFHAIQTLLQLFPPSPATKSIPAGAAIPYVSILDYPRFAYRGMHLDVSRHLFPLAFIKKYIDYLAYHKLNRFHWHLTDDQGWRIEIKKYPRLTSTGGWRNGTIIGRYPGKGSDNKHYGGFYTQAEVREVVRYAKERFIEVIPEIEMPGHGSAAIAAYPPLSCFPEQPTFIAPAMISRKSADEQANGRIKLVQETWGVFDDVFCAGNDSTFIFLQNVIDEVIPLFPSSYFHIGGDECPKTHWKKCPRCQQRMKDHNLKDEHELQSYFVQRIEKYLNNKGKTLIGWDEILEGGLAPNAVVMSWRGETGGIEAAKQKHPVIMTPGNPVYFDHTQSLNEDSVTIGGYNPIEKVYAYDPIPKELTAEEAKFILGAQANVWTEYIKNTRKVEYMIFPRMAALSEILWSPKENRNWEHFEKRLPAQFMRYERWNANHSLAYYDIKATVLPAENFEGLLWKLEKKGSRGQLSYAQGASSLALSYSEPVKILQSDNYVGMLSDSKGVIRSISSNFQFNKATGKKITLKEEASSKYPGDGAFSLVNGIQNEKGMARTGEFLGFEGSNCEALIDLGQNIEVNEIVIHTLEQPGSWIYFPSAFDISISTDGNQFTAFSSGVNIIKSADQSKFTIKLASPALARYLRILIMNRGIIPPGNPGAGHKAWLFIDEIEVF